MRIKLDTKFNGCVEIEPIKEKEGDEEVQLYDIYVDDCWHGSRRTIDQVHHYINHLMVEIVNE